MRYAIALVAVLMAGPAAGQQAVTGNELLAWCRAPDPFSQGACLGFLRGSIEAHLATVTSRGLTPLLCIPAGVTVAQIRDIVVKYLVETPQFRHDEAGGLAPWAATLTFTCR